MTRIRKLKGFTLIEIIVVVIIIGILAAIAAVAYNQFVGNSRTKSVAADATSLRKAIDVKAAQDELTPQSELHTLMMANKADSTKKVLTALGFAGSSSTTITTDGVAATGTTMSTTATKVVLKAGSRYTTINLGTTTSSPSSIVEGAGSDQTTTLT